MRKKSDASTGQDGDAAAVTPPLPAAATEGRRSFVNPYRLEDCKTYALKGCSWRVQGHAHAGERSGYFVHGPDVVVDCGLPTMKTPLAVCLTHRHTDHSLGLPSIISARTAARKGQEHLTGRPVLMPSEAVPMIAHLCASVAWLSDGVQPTSPEAALQRIGVHPLPVEPGVVLTIPGVKDVQVEILPGHHGDTASVGYGFSMVKEKLRPEYSALQGAEIAALRKAGKAVTSSHVEPVLLIYGDTTPDALLLHDEWRKYPNIFIECTRTAVEPDDGKQKHSVQQSRERGHTHVTELLPILEANQEGRRWFIHHTSLAHTPAEVRAAFASSTLTDFELVLDD